jgi:hypothetical protein
MNRVTPFASLALALLAASAAAQQPAEPAPQTAEPSVESLWLTELLDLDSASAARGYEKLAHDPQQPVVTRWLAAARLVELQRLGVGTDARPPAMNEAPVALQKLFAEVEPIVDVAKIAANVTAGAQRPPGELIAELRDHGNAIPSLRPLTPEVMQWQPERDLRRPRQGMRRNSFLEPLHAAQILHLEMTGDSARASARRALYFDQWKPPVWKGELEELSRLVLTRVNEMKRARERGPQELRDFDRLSELLREASAKGPTHVQDLLARLPLYADRLVANPEAQPR